MTFGVLDIVKRTMTGEEIKYVSDAIKNERLKICLSCSDLNRLLKVCKICHCPVYNKTRFSESECPKQKWLALVRSHPECFEENGSYYFQDSRMKLGPFPTLEICKNSLTHYIGETK